MDQDMSEAIPVNCNKPLKVYTEGIESEVLALDRWQPAKKHVPEWY